MQVAILAGGLGTRLRPVIQDVPKPMVKIAGLPFLERQVGYLAGQGFRRLLLLVGYRAEQITDYLDDGRRLGVQVAYSREEVPLGTGGALRRALPLLEERFLLLYGDSFLPMDYRPMVQAFEGAPDLGGMMAVFQDCEGITGVDPNVALRDDGRVARYAKGSAAGVLTHVEAGAVALRAQELGHLPLDRPCSLEDRVYPELVSRGRMGAWATRQRFYDIGTPEGLRKAEAFFRSREAAGPAAVREAP